MKTSYAEKLKDPRWWARRAEILKLHDYTCRRCACGYDDDELHVHHLCYRPQLDPWEYADCDLVPLCRKCHEEVHEFWSRDGEMIPKLLRRAGLDENDFESVVEYLTQGSARHGTNATARRLFRAALIILAKNYANGELCHDQPLWQPVARAVVESRKDWQ